MHDSMRYGGECWFLVNSLKFGVSRADVQAHTRAVKIMKKSICRPLHACAAIVLGVFAPPGLSQDAWETIGRDRDREVQIDRRTILQSDGGTKVAWGRIVLSPTEAEKEGYASIKALSRFDCFNRSFHTVKRVYLDAQNMVLRDESVIDERPILAARNSVDERMWREVCQPGGGGSLQELAAEAGRVAAAASGVATTPPPPAPAAPPAATPAPSVAPAPTIALAAVVTPAPVAPPAVTPPPARVIQPPSAPIAPAAARSEPRAPATVVTQARRERERVNLAASRAATQARVRAVMGSVGSAEQPQAASDAPWSFAGTTGPEHWGRMRPEWSVCADGDRQSPIDLDDGLDVNLEPVVFDYRPSAFRVLDTGPSLVVQVDEGLAATVRGQRHALVHLQFHHPMLERIDGERFDMAVQLHHRSAEGRVLIVVVPMVASGEANAALQTVWNNLPLERGAAYQAAASLDLAALLPRTRAHYLYMGSLSQPPCTENITWVVMRTPLAISGEQLRLFARMYPMNARPPQPANDRRVLRSR